MPFDLVMRANSDPMISPNQKSLLPRSPSENLAGRHRDCLRVAKNALSLIGCTPLVQLANYLDQPSIELYGKLESANPGGSAKDRSALRMLDDAYRRGLVNKRSIVVESSSGNMGIGLAQACCYLSLPFVCVTDPYAQPQNLAIMRALGADIELVESAINGSYLAARLVRVQEILATNPNAFWPNQYANLENARAHELGTIEEIDRVLDGQFDYVFVATSSTGTARGCRDYLRKAGRATKVIAVDSCGSVLFGGKQSKRHIPGLGAGIVPRLAKNQEFDGLQRVSDLDCVIGCRRVAKREALLVGGSAGGVLESVRRMQDELAGETCVAILADSGTRYLETVFSDSWVRDTLGQSALDSIAEYQSPRPRQMVSVE